MTRDVLSFLATLLVVSSFTRGLRAQESSIAEKQFGVDLSGDDSRLRFEIYSLAKGANRRIMLYNCGNPCRALLARGQYRIRVSGGSEQIAGDRLIEATRDVSLRFSLPRRSDNQIGKTFGITFATNREPEMEEARHESARLERKRASPRIGFGAAPVPGGAAAGVWGRF